MRRVLAPRGRIAVRRMVSPFDGAESLLWEENLQAGL